MSSPWWNIASFFALLVSQQALVQLATIPVRQLQSDKRHWFLVLSRQLTGYSLKPNEVGVGVTGLLFHFSSILFQFWQHFPLATSVLLSMLTLFLLVKCLGIYFGFLIYTKGGGFGFNIFYNGERLIGFDYHSFPLRQNKTGIRQQLVTRPHIDIPMLMVRYWPWDIGIKRYVPDEQHEMQKEEKKKAKMLKKIDALASIQLSDEKMHDIWQLLVHPIVTSCPAEDVRIPHRLTMHAIRYGKQLQLVQFTSAEIRKAVQAFIDNTKQ